MKVLKTLFSLFVIVFIPLGLMLWMRIHQSSGFAARELIAYPLLFGGGSIFILLLLKKYLLKEPLKDFNSAPGSWASDLGWGLVLTAVYFLLFFVFRATLSDLLEFRSNTELLGLMLQMREHPFLLILWFGPVLWIGIALYEELLRTFLLTSLWKFSQHRIWIALVIFLSAILMGIAHWSQGPYGVVTISLKGLITAFFYYKKRRLMPLIYAHALYDGLQVAVLLATYPA